MFFSITIGFSVSEQSSVFGIWVKEQLDNLVLTYEKELITGNVWIWWTRVQGQLGLDYSTTLLIVALGLSFILLILTLLGVMWLYKRVYRLNRFLVYQVFGFLKP